MSHAAMTIRTAGAAGATTTATTAPLRYPHRPHLQLLVREETDSRYGGGDGTLRTGSVAQGEPETVADWGRVHARIVELGAARAVHERELCRSLVAAERLGVAARAGYGSLREYVGRVVGLSGRQTEERLRVGRALAQLPRLDRALAAGKLGFSAVRELSRVAQPDTEQEWLEWAGGKTTRQIEQAVAARRPGDGPQAPADRSRITHRLAFAVRAETMALFRDLQAAVRRDLGGGGEVDDDTLLYEIARRALGGPDEAGRSSYQVALTRCELCGSASIDAGGQSHAVDQVVAEMAACDSQQLWPVGGTREEDGGGSSPRVGAEDSVGEGAPPSPASPSPRVGAEDSVGEGAPPSPRVGAEDSVGEGAPPSPRVGATAVATAPRRRASQTVPPATRRAVMRRDGQRCAAPGCQNHRFLDIHHVDPRAEGGRHDPERMLMLCGSHHRQVHAGRLCIDGSATDGFTFRHADGTPYGGPLRPAALELAQQVFSALRQLGFRHARARALIDAVVQAGAPDDLEAFLRAALQAS